MVVKEENLVLGKEVMRGPDWNGQDQDGGDGKLGILLSSRDGWVHVRWGWSKINESYSNSHSYSHRYRIGAEGKYDLIYAGNKREREKLSMSNNHRNNPKNQHFDAGDATCHFSAPAQGQRSKSQVVFPSKGLQ